MCPCARPRPILGPLCEARLDRVLLYLAHARKNVPFIHWERVEAFLPKMTAPSMTEIYLASVAFVSLSGRFGHENEMGIKLYAQHSVAASREPSANTSM